MQSKTSYFSKTIFVKNITHFWPIWVAYLLVCLYRLPMQIYSNLNAQVTDVLDIESLRLTMLEETVSFALQPLPLFLFACITAVAVFSYLYQSKSAHMFHAYPLCRESLYISNILSGLCFLIIPQIIAFLAAIFVCFIQHMTQLECLMHWLILSSGMAVFAFALATFTVMITGNIVAAPIFFLIINYGFVACRSVISWFAENLSYGITNASFTFGSFLSPLYCFSSWFGNFIFLYFNPTAQQPEMPQLYVYIGGYFAASIPIFLLAFFIYKKKHLETCGDTITVPFLNPLFRWIIAFCAGSCFCLFGVPWITGGDEFADKLTPTLVFLILGGVLVFFLSEMFLAKKFQVFTRKKCLECGIFVVLSAALIISIHLDFFKMETRIPAEEEISSIFLYGAFPIDVNEADFSEVCTLHKSLIDSKEEFQSYFKKYGIAESTTIQLEYTLKNGQKLSRSYSIPTEEYYLSQEDYVYHQLAALSDNPEYYLEYHFTTAYESLTFVEGTLDLYAGNSYWDFAHLTQAECNEIYEALKKDIREGNYRIHDYSVYSMVSDEIYYNSLFFYYSVPAGTPYVSYNGKNTVLDSDMLQSTALNLTVDCKHTLALLTDMGIITENQRLLTQTEADILYMEDSTYHDVDIYH